MQWVSHTCQLSYHWFRYWLVTWLAPSHFLTQCWFIVNWTIRNNLKKNFNQITTIFIQENALKMSAKFWPNCLVFNVFFDHFCFFLFDFCFFLNLKYFSIFHLTLYVRGPSYLGLTRSISWLLMPWLLASPGQQQPWYWLCRIGSSLSYSRRNFNYLCLISVEEWHKM